MKYLLFVLFTLLECSVGAQVLRKRSATLMGGRFDISIVANDSITAEQNIDSVIAEISRIEDLISDWKPGSQISEVNKQAGVHAVKVDREVFDLTQRAPNPIFMPGIFRKIVELALSSTTF